MNSAFSNRRAVTEQCSLTLSVSVEFHVVMGADDLAQAGLD